MQDISRERKLRTVNLSRVEQQLALGIFVLLVASLFYNLGLAPLKHEEPRRALIALEMLFRDNWIVPTEFGEYYYKKPPLYNWVIIAGFKIFGNYSELAVRFLSIISFIGTGLLVFCFGQKYVSRTYGILAGLLTLCMVDILYYFSTTAGEIDLFYSLVTLASFFTIYYFYQKQQYYGLFIVTYLLGAIGTLTKGLPSVVFLGISLGIFFLYKGEFGKLFSLQHFAGLAVFLLIVGGYFLVYSQYNSLEGFYARDESLWSQASERTVLENGFTKFIKHFFSFPLITLKNIAPASLVLIFLSKDVGRRFRENSFITFCLLILLANIVVYWISPGTRSRYLYMLYPLAVMGFTFLYTSYPVDEEKRHRYLALAVTVLSLMALLASLALPFIPVLAELDGMLLVTILSSATLAVLLWLSVRKQFNTVLLLILLAVIIRFIFGATVLPLRASKSSEAIDKADAARIAEIVGDAPLYMYAGENISRTTVFYLEAARQQVLPYCDATDTQSFFLASKALLEGKTYRLYHTFSYDEQAFGLIKFTQLESDPARQGR
jgi:4-amino-4-deoxy-L-arabinose transferase-like glycosyltransferase